MKVFLVLLMVAFTTAHHHELIEKYGCRKIFESCFGKSLMESKMNEFKTHMAACKTGNTQVANNVRTFDWNSVFNSENSPFFLPIPVGQNPNPFFSRQKRHSHFKSSSNIPYFTEEKIRETKDSFVEKMKLGACVLQRMKILDSNMNMQWNSLKALYQEINIDPELKQDLLEVNTKCQNLVQCIPLNQQKLGSFPIGLKQAFIYFKCEKPKKIEACMKKDLRLKSDMFELQGLDGLLDHIQEDDEKMLKVLKIFTKFGDNDFDIFN